MASSPLLVRETDTLMLIEVVDITAWLWDITRRQTQIGSAASSLVEELGPSPLPYDGAEHLNRDCSRPDPFDRDGKSRPGGVEQVIQASRARASTGCWTAVRW
jgi:hypothetical protein